MSRHSEDTTLNSYEKRLLSMCVELGLRIMNGTRNGDLQGRYTHTSDTGSSVNDFVCFDK